MDERPLDAEELGTEHLFRTIFVPRWFADALFRLWLKRHRRRSLK